MAHAHQVDDKPRMTLARYQEIALSTNRLNKDVNARDYLRFGVFGEIGGLLALIKKAKRELVAADHNAVTEEIGDALWYIANVAHAYELSLNAVGASAMADLHERFGMSGPVDGDLAFTQFNGLMDLCNGKLPVGDLGSLLREVAVHTGKLLQPDSIDKESAPQIAGLLATLLADLVTLAAVYHQRISEIVEWNVDKIRSRWPVEGTRHIPLFDAERPELEQFPRDFRMHFIQRSPPDGRGNPYVIQRLNDVNIGDRLTDNRTQADGYRFHDVFHLAYMVHLGWSPVLRALLKVKRKSDANLDENQDGARAIIIEEGVATWIFNQAYRRAYFRDVEVGRLDYNLLKQVRDMVDGFEVDQCPLWQWERAILDGFKVFNSLYEAGGGIIHCSLADRILEWEPAPQVARSTAQREPSRSVLVGALPPSE
jgi:NTP pyrophosphatase (non-canonical NTP hydrolase)